MRDIGVDPTLLASLLECSVKPHSKDLQKTTPFVTSPVDKCQE
jgi:hypothetical protein